MVLPILRKYEGGSADDFHDFHDRCLYELILAQLTDHRSDLLNRVINVFLALPSRVVDADESVAADAKTTIAERRENSLAAPTTPTQKPHPVRQSLHPPRKDVMKWFEAGVKGVVPGGSASTGQLSTVAAIAAAIFVVAASTIAGTLHSYAS
jgi:hypothetical protein